MWRNALNQHKHHNGNGEEKKEMAAK